MPGPGAAPPRGLSVDDCIRGWAASPLAQWRNAARWQLTSRSDEIVGAMRRDLSADEFVVDGDIATHRTAGIEPGAALNGPLIIDQDLSAERPAPMAPSRHEPHARRPARR